MDFNFDDVMNAAGDMMQGDIPDPFQDPPVAEPQMQGRAFGGEPIDDAPPPVEAPPPPVEGTPVMDQGQAFGSSMGGDYLPVSGDHPYQVPNLANTIGGRLMEPAIGQLIGAMGADEDSYYGGRAGGNWRDDWERRNGGYDADFDRSVIDWRSSGVDMSGEVPTARWNNLKGDEFGSQPIRNFNDLSGVASPWAAGVMRDTDGNPITDDAGRVQRYNLPGSDMRWKMDQSLYPTRLENNQTILADRNNPGLLWNTNADGTPNQRVQGGLGYENFSRREAQLNNYIPTTDSRGNPVYYDEASNRTWVRNPDGSAGRQILDVNGRAPTFLNGQRVNAPVSRGGGFVPTGRNTQSNRNQTQTQDGGQVYPDMSGLAGPDERLAAGLGSGGLGPTRTPQSTIPEQRVSPIIPVTNPNEQNALRIPPGSVKQKFDTGEGTPAIYRYTTPDGTVIITDAQGNILQRNR